MKRILKSTLAALVVMVSAIATAQDDFEAEFVKVQGIAKAYGSAWSLPDSKFEEFLTLARERDANIKICSDFYAKYKSDVEKRNDRGRRVETLIGHTKAQFTMYLSQAQDYGEKFNHIVTRKFESVDQQMKIAVDSKSAPMYLHAKNSVQEVRAWCKVIQAFNGDNDPAAAEVLKKVEAYEADLTKKHAAMEKATKRVVKMPTEGYSGSDKEKHRSAIKKAWQAEYSGDKILKIVFPEGWERKSEWNHNGNGNYSKSDMSYLVAWVVVQKDSKSAMMYPAYVNKDNLSGKISYGVKTKGGSFVNDEIELSKVK